MILFGEPKGPVYRVADTGSMPEPVTRLDAPVTSGGTTAGLSVR